MTLKQQVLIALVKKGWSQRELARQMGISITYLRDIFIEKRKPKERLKQIEELLDIKLEVDSSNQPEWGGEKMNNQTPRYEKSIPVKEYSRTVKTALEEISKSKYSSFTQLVLEEVQKNGMSYVEANEALRLVDAALYEKVLNRKI